MKNILQKIIEQKRTNLHKIKASVDLLFIKDRINQGLTPVLRPFITALKESIDHHGIAIISELKKASPSKGLLKENYLPKEIAKTYQQHGATCLSVLTETDFFMGHDEHLITAKNNTDLPVLRKDFIIDPYQIYESRHLGADCILLIASALKPQQLQEFYHLAISLELDVFVEVINEEELALALTLENALIGINNRDLKNFAVDLNKTITLAKNIPEGRLVVCESGIRNRQDILHMQQQNIHIFLIGEAIMKADNPGKKLEELLNLK